MKRVLKDWRRWGGKKPPGVIDCTRPGRWGNPFKAGELWFIDKHMMIIYMSGKSKSEFGENEVWVRDITHAVELFREYARRRLDMERRCGVKPGWLDHLRGATGLACTCKSGPCHVDVLLEFLGCKK